ncbi:hypothetical protein BKA81DRAFT_405007 [Phyllosticta paracitricarpa]|uniref:Uncharacterized protein n=2 Tax=Phyllosticta TaxID=121621 RepID=A0ABR1MDT4_9PEZI
MRRQRLRAGQAHSVCAFCASRLARDATRLLPYSPSPLQIRESSRLERLAHVAVESDSQPSAEGNRHPASTHASPLNISTTSNAQSEKQDAPKSSAEDAADDLSFMDAEGRRARRSKAWKWYPYETRSSTGIRKPATVGINW